MTTTVTTSAPDVIEAAASAEHHMKQVMSGSFEPEPTPGHHGSAPSDMQIWVKNLGPIAGERHLATIGGPAPSDMQIWVKNLGPIAGERHLATIGGPGLWEIIGPNTSGKSTLAQVMLLFGEGRLLTSDAACVTDGESSGYLYMSPSCLVFETNPAGNPMAPVRTGAEALSIEAIPDPVDLLISGGNSRQRSVKDKAARARNRLGQLLAFAPINATEEMLGRLCRAMDERVFCAPPTIEQAIAWDLLMAEVGDKVARFKPIPCLSPDQVRAQVMDARQKGTGSVLDDQQAMHKLLNSLATAAGHAATQQRATIAHAKGRIDEGVAAAARRFGETQSMTFRRRIETWTGDIGELKQDLEVARSTAARVRVNYENRQKEQGRRDVLSISHGERPDDTDEQAQAQAAQLALQDATEARGRIESTARAAEVRLVDAGSLLDERNAEIKAAWNVWATETFRVSAALPMTADKRVIASGALTIAAFDEITGAVVPALEALSFAVRSALEVRETHRQAVAEMKNQGDARGNVKAAVSVAEETLRVAEKALAKITAQVEQWGKTAALIAEAVPGPGEEEVADADRAVEMVQAAISMGEASAELLKLVAEHQAEDSILTWLTDLEYDYREAAAASWLHLGDILTEYLSLPWLRVKGMDLILVFDAETRRLATAATTQRDERRLDDQKRVSTAELHGAMLKLMLDRRKVDIAEGGRSPIIILPWDYERPSAIAALDDRRKGQFAADVEDAGLTVYAERPRRDGEPEEVQMVKVEAIR